MIDSLAKEIEMIQRAEECRIIRTQKGAAYFAEKHAPSRVAARVGG
jgi:hypothetical protein